MNYSEKLKNPKWQKMRLKIFERDEFTCQSCFEQDKPLTVHHFYYDSGKEPWDYPLESLITLCKDCHEGEYEQRKDYERMLLDILRKKKVWAGNIYVLVEIFCEFPFDSFEQFQFYQLKNLKKYIKKVNWAEKTSNG